MGIRVRLLILMWVLPAAEFTVAETELERGERLTRLMCAACHYNSSTGRLSGRWMDDLPAIAGKVFSDNITWHPASSISGYTPTELKRLLRTGIKKDGNYTPFMVFPELSDRDVAALTAFLNSGHPLTEPHPGSGPKSPRPAANALLQLKSRKKIDWQSPRPHPSLERDPETYGRYLVHNLGCYDCHSRSLLAVNRREPEKTRGYLTGGMRLRDATGKIVRSPNLTPCEETGIGNWPEADLHRALTRGILPDGTPVLHPMPLYPDLTTEETAAIHRYLHSLEPVRHRVKRVPRGTSRHPGEAAELFAQKGCASCHGADGGGPVADLTEAAAKYSRRQIERYISNPARFAGNPFMPPYEQTLNKAEIKTLAAYVVTLCERDQE